MGKRALILDDDRNKANLVSVWLEKSGVETDKVYTYDEAIKRIHLKYDLLVLDYYLDGNHTGSEFAIQYQKKHPGCQIYVYSALPGEIKDYTTIDLNDLETFIQDKILFAKSPLDKGSEPETKAYDIFVIKQKIDDELVTLKETVARHDEKILNHEKNQIEFKKDLEKLALSVSVFIDKHDNDAKKIIYWITGVLITVFIAFVGIEWTIIEHLVKQFVK